MKILYDAKVFYIQKYGGVSKYFNRLSNEISNYHDARIVAPIYLSNYIDEFSHTKKIKFLKINKHYKNTRFISNYINQKFFELYYNYFKPEIVHLTYYENQLYFKKKSKIVLTIFDLIHEKFMTKYDFSYKYLSKKNYLENADQVICISNSCKKDLLEFYNIDEKKIDVVYLGVDLNKDYKIIDDDYLKKPYILYVGSRDNYKNFDKFIKAFSLSERLIKNFNIVCFGGKDFSKEEIELFKNCKLQLSKIKRFTGNDELLRYVYKKAKIYVCPSLYEGFGLTILEAMAMDCPVISSNAGALQEVGGDIASYFNPNDIDEMSYKIEKILFSNQDLDFQLKNSKHHLRKFSWKNTADQTMKIYEKIC